MPRAALIVNPAASRVRTGVVSAVARELAAAGPVETLVTERSRHAVELARAASRGFDRLFVLSGDGGFNEVVNGVDGDVPVGFIPGGATNVLPRALGLPRDPVRCARVLARSRARRQISLGRVTFSPPGRGGRAATARFAFSAGVGLDAELVRAVDRLGRARGSRPSDLAFVLALLRLVARRRGRFEPSLAILERRRAAFALVANCDPYTYLGRLPLHAAPGARFELGLDVVAPERLRARALPRLVWWAFAGTGGQCRASDVLCLHDADAFAIACDEAMPLQTDGEDLGDVREAVFAAERGALEVIVP